MLPPDYLAACGQEIMAMYEELNITITQDIVRRIVKTGKITTMAALQARMAQEAGAVLDDIIAEVSKATWVQKKGIKKLFEEAGVDAIKYDAEPLIKAGIPAATGLSKSMTNILEANALKTQGNMSNLCMTTASTGQQAFIDTMNQSVMMVESGAFDYQTVLRRAINKASQIGTRVRYDSGRSVSLEAAARMNVLTSLNQTAGRISIMNGERLGCEYYETSAHVGARPTHQDWQGHVFKIEGADEYGNFYEETGYGEPDGLCGVNCRHSFYPYFPGISERAYSDETLEEYGTHKVTYDDTEYSDYEASQIQRKLERNIRASKREVAGYKAAIEEAEDAETKKNLKDGLKEAQAALRVKRGKLTDFCNQTGRQKESIRVKTAIAK